MGFLSLNLLRSRDSRQKLPVYEPLDAPFPSKERYSSTGDSSDDDDDDDDDGDSDYSAPSSSGTYHSRHTSDSFDSSAMMLPKSRRAVFAAETSPSRRTTRPYFYRLPNKVIRYLCIAMISTILLFIFSLVRASQVENRRIANGEVAKAPAAPPPWESFNFLTRYYGGLKSLVPFKENIPQYPRDEDEQPFNATRGDVFHKPHFHPDDHKLNEGSLPPSKPFPEHPGSVFASGQTGFTKCFVDKENTVSIPPIRYFDGRPSGFPENIYGSYDLLSLPEDICFERYGRFGPYGYGYAFKNGGLGAGQTGHKEGSEEVWKTVREVDWRGIDWADAQKRCYGGNAGRFKSLPPPHKAPSRGFYIGKGNDGVAMRAREEYVSPETEQQDEEADAPPTESTPPPKKVAGDLPRTAIVLRCWDEYNWGDEDVLNVRSLIAELALASGGHYDLHLLVQVKNEARYPIWADDDTYEQRIRDAIPAEFQGLVTLWTETQMLAMYQGIYDLWTRGPNLPVHGVYRGLQMAMQHFAYNHPEYDHFWQWEMDIRYTGHYYDLFSKMENWAKEQPRKGLWERNARFYFPSEHGSWDDFRQMARVQTELGTTGADNIWKSLPGSKKGPQETVKGEETVWGPVRPLDANDWYETEGDPVPPTTYEKDKYVWGVGEEADYISLNPLFNPEGTTWELGVDITGYNESEGIGKPPRRAQIITASRMSRRLLLHMHRETAFKKRHAFPEMWPATVALQHGLKAVSVPHPVYVDREWPTQYMANTFNGGRNGASGGSRTSVFGQREHNFMGVTWFYNSGFGPNMYRRWLGLKVNNDGGEQFELEVDESKDETTVGDMRGGEGRMCLPPMLIHPVKNIELPAEDNPEELAVNEPEMGPDA